MIKQWNPISEVKNPCDAELIEFLPTKRNFTIIESTRSKISDGLLTALQNAICMALELSFLSSHLTPDV